jgi:hypothetical protein
MHGARLVVCRTPVQSGQCASGCRATRTGSTFCFALLWAVTIGVTGWVGDL